MSTPDPNAPYRDRIIDSKRELKALLPDLATRFAAMTARIEAQVAAIEADRARGAQDRKSVV